jgi:hypothetical protein
MIDLAFGVSIINRLSIVRDNVANPVSVRTAADNAIKMIRNDRESVINALIAAVEDSGESNANRILYSYIIALMIT